MSNFLNQFKNENYQQDMDENQESMANPQEEGDSNTDSTSFGKEYVNQSLAASINEGNKSEDEKIAEILMALNVSEAFDDLDDEEDIAPAEPGAEENVEEFPGEDSDDFSESTPDEGEDDDPFAQGAGSIIFPTDEDDEHMDAEDDEDYIDNLSAAERAMRETEIIMPVSSESERDTESFDSDEVKRRHRSSPRAKIAPTDHQVVRDTKHGKRKMVRFLVTAFIILAIAGAGFFAYWMNSRVEVPDFVGSTIAEQRNWELTNRVTLEVTEEFSLEFDKDVIMAQDKPPGSHVRRGDVLRLTVSQGADPNERIVLPDFEQMTIIEVREWIEEYRLNNVNVNEEYNDVVPEGRFIRMEFPQTGVTAENYTRGDGLLLFMSRGIEVLPENIPVPNFVGRTKADVETWAREHDITVHVVEATSATVAVDSIISQNIEPRTMVARESDITITVSLGPSVIVPNFATMTMEEAENYPDLKVVVRKRFHGTLPFGELIYQSEEPGTELIGEGAEVVVYFSLGRPFIESLVGKSENVVPAIFYDFTSQGADISYYIIYVDSHLPRGEIVEMSKFNQWLYMEDYVNIWVSRGNLPPPPTPPTPPDNDTDNNGD